MTTGPGINRRRTLSGAAALAVGMPVLAACGDDGSTATDTSGSTGSSSPSGSGGGSGGASGELTTTSDVPVGGGTILDAEKVVVTQPAEGDFKAFTSICTHQGCPVSSVSDGTINCTCHGSKFSIEDGSVVQGPATRPLDEVDISVEGDAISLA